MINSLGRESRPPWGLLWLLVAVQVAVSVLQYAVPVLLPFLRSDLDLRGAEIGAVAAATQAGSAFALLAAGRAAERWGEGRTLAVGLAVAGGFVLCAARTEAFLPLFLALVGAGLGAAASHPAGTRAVARAFPAHRRALAMSLRQTAVTVGAMLAALLAPRLAQRFDWQTVLTLAALLVMLTAPLALFALRGHAGAPVAAADRVPLRRLVRRRPLLLATVLSMLLAAGQFCFGAYLTLDARDRFGLSVTGAAALLALAHLASIAARIALGAVSDRRRLNRAPVIGMLGLTATVLLVLLAMLPAGTPAPVLAVCAAALGASVLGWTGLMSTLIAEVAGMEAAATAAGFQLTLLFAAVAVAPPAFGVVVEVSGYRVAWLALAVLLAPTPLLARTVREEGNPGSVLPVRLQPDT